MLIELVLAAQLGVETYLRLPSSTVGPWTVRCASSDGQHKRPLARCVATYEKDGVRLVWDRTKSNVQITADISECPPIATYPHIQFDSGVLKGRNSKAMVAFSIWNVLNARQKDCPDFQMPDMPFDLEALSRATDPTKAELVN